MRPILSLITFLVGAASAYVANNVDRKAFVERQFNGDPAFFMKNPLKIQLLPEAAEILRALPTEEYDIVTEAIAELERTNIPIEEELNLLRQLQNVGQEERQLILNTLRELLGPY